MASVFARSGTALELRSSILLVGAVQVHCVLDPVYSEGMATFLTRLFGLLLLTVAISATSCQAVFQTGSSINAPERLSPGSFQHDR
jgi:hypothetical protein